jgi:tetratricopeptide (TPR) repeat protein
MARHTKGSKKSSRTEAVPQSRVSGAQPVLSASSLQQISSTLALAEEQYDRQENQAALNTLAPLESQYPFADNLLCGRFDRMLAFAYSHLKRLSDAEQVIRRGLERHPAALDFHYTNCFIQLSLRNFDAALQSAQRFLKYREELTVGQNSILDSTSSQLTHLLNFMGAAYQDLDQLENAEAAFEQAIQADPGNHLPYLNLANLFARKKAWGKVTESIDRGLKKCRRINELRMLNETYKKRATVSACIMVKNEEEMLPECLDSIRDWVDEIIIVDTGSTDRTVEIATSYGAKVYHHPWENSFSKARNHTLQYATCDWVFIIDADERIFAEDIPNVMQALNQDQFPIVAVSVFNYYPLIEDTVTFLPSKRFFRRSLGLQYSGIVHNQLLVPAGTPTVKTGIRIKHYGYGLSKERMEAKLARTKALLEKQLADQPDDAFALFNYAQLHRASPDGFKPENAAIVLKSAGRAIQLTSPDNPDNRHIYYMCLDQLAWTHYYLQNYDEAERCCLQALKTKPGYLDPLLLLGYVTFCKNDPEQSRQYFEKYLTAHAAYNPADETENIILLNLGGRADALFNLGVLAELRSDWRAAKEYYTQTLEANPEYHSANFALGRAALRENDAVNAERFFVRQLKVGRHMHDSLLSLAQIAVQQSSFEKAEEYCRRALEESPNSIPALLEYARLSRQLGHPVQAVELFRKGIDAGCTDPAVRVELAECQSACGDFSSAIATYEQLIREHPESPTYLNDLGNCHYRLGDFGQAERLYQQSLALHPDQVETVRNLGLTLARLQRSPEAIACLKRYLKQRPEDADIQHVMGDLYLSSKAPEEALSHFEQYLRRNPADSRAFFRLAECYLLMGHKDSAVLGYQKSLELDPRFAPAKERLSLLVEHPMKA